MSRALALQRELKEQSGHGTENGILAATTDPSASYASQSSSASKVKASADDDNNTTERKLHIQYHYEVALKLRPNFPLAALNLAATLGPSDEAIALLFECAIRMEANQTRSHQKHVQTQLECLVSALKLCLHRQNNPHQHQYQHEIHSEACDPGKQADLNNQHSNAIRPLPRGISTSTSNKPPIDQRQRQRQRQRQQQQQQKQQQLHDMPDQKGEHHKQTKRGAVASRLQSSSIRQTTSTTRTTTARIEGLRSGPPTQGGSASSIGCSICNQLHWIREISRKLAKQIEAYDERGDLLLNGDISSDNTRRMRAERRDEYLSTDGFKQMAQIHWLLSQLDDDPMKVDHQLQGLDGKQLLRNEAIRFALQSSFPIEAQLYIDQLEHDYDDARIEKSINNLRQYIQLEESKRTRPKLEDDGMSTMEMEGAEELAKLYAKLAHFVGQQSRRPTEKPNSGQSGEKQQLELLSRAHSLAPNSADLASDLAHQLYLAGQLDRSESLYKKALQLEQRHWEQATRSEKRSPSSNNNNKKEKSKSSEPDSILIMNDFDRRRLVKAHTNLGAILQVRAKWSEAFVEFKEAVRLTHGAEWPSHDSSRRIAETNLRNLELKMEKQNKIKVGK